MLQLELLDEHLGWSNGIDVFLGCRTVAEFFNCDSTSLTSGKSNFLCLSGCVNVSFCTHGRLVVHMPARLHIGRIAKNYKSLAFSARERL